MLKIAIIVHENGKYYVKTENGSRTLGTHETRRDAEIQLYAIHKSQERESKKEKKASMIWSERYSAKTKDVVENKYRYTPALEANGGVSRADAQHCGRCDILIGKSNKAKGPMNKEFGIICNDCKDVLR